MASLPEVQVPHSVVEEMVADHELIKRLFVSMMDGNTDLWPVRFCELKQTLVQHEVAEELVVYPAFHEYVVNPDDMLDARLAEQAEAEEQLKRMEAMEESDPAFAEALQSLQTAVLAHAQHEEAEVIPLLERFVDSGVLLELGDKYEMAKLSAPTHPHPHVPDRPPGNRLLGPVVAMADKMRDARSG